MLGRNLKLLTGNAAVVLAPVGRQPLAPRLWISTWDRVVSSMWHPMATVEQSLMDMERLTSQLLSGRAFPFSRGLLPRMHDDEDDFFKDLEASPNQEPVSPKQPQAQSMSKGKTKEEHQGDASRSFSSYSFSSSTLLDAHGHRISSIRRRYEDSTGRLKAVHEREIDGKKLRNMWRRTTANDKGEHHTVCMGSSSEEFEEQWKETPFGQAEKHHGEGQRLGSQEAGDSRLASKSSDLEELSQKQHHKTAFGVDYEAAEAAPDKAHDSEEAIPEAKARSRDDAIAEGSKNQEEETTPPEYCSSKSAPGKTHGSAEATPEAQARSRDDAIAEGTKNQEEETTPHEYTSSKVEPKKTRGSEAKGKNRDAGFAEDAKNEREKTTPPQYSG